MLSLNSFSVARFLAVLATIWTPGNRHDKVDDCADESIVLRAELVVEVVYLVYAGDLIGRPYTDRV